MTEPPQMFDAAAPWRALSYRFTVFFKDHGSFPDGDNAFKAFFGAPHGEKIEKPSEFAEVFHLVDPNCLSEMNRTPRKLDFIIRAPVNRQFDDEKKPSLVLTSCDGEIEGFRERIRNFLAVHAQSCVRLAVGAELVVQVPDRETGYQVLGGRLLTLKPDYRVANELSYKINYPRVRTFDGASLKINRLFVWHCSRLRVETKADETTKVEEIYFARVTLDVNTDPSFDVSSLNPGSQVNLVDTFFDFVAEVAEKGEIP